MDRQRPLRVLIAKPGLDGHNRGAKVVAHALREAGMEVIYTGLHQTVDEIAEAALQEDVDVIGLSILSGAHLPLTAGLMQKLRDLHIEDIAVVVGGNIPYPDRQKLLDLGVRAVFPTSSRFAEIARFFQQLAETGIGQNAILPHKGEN
ncbi:MAG: cobalamin B12-binding domain-containing protein [Ardenticatenaceae bacterium]|nr:cobalamin B12-binding domain-containing protein [Ardenticatenaceae bacterium]